MANPLPFPDVWAANSPNLRDPTANELDVGFECGTNGLRELHNRLFQDLQQAVNALSLRNGQADIPVNGWQTTPPASPAVGDRYVVLPTGTGAWTGQGNKIALYDGTTWVFADPVSGLQAQYYSGRQIVIRYDGSTWAEDLATNTGPGRVSLDGVRDATPGRLIAVRYFTSSTTYTPTAGTKSIEVELVGGGGGGGGSSATSSTQVSAGSGGGAGGYSRRRITSGFSSVPVTVGAAGLGAQGSGGGNGEASSFGAFLSATGGQGGLFGVAASSTTAAPNGGAPGGRGTGGDLNSDGGYGMYGFYSAFPVSGAGGASAFGGGAYYSSGTAGGNPAFSRGAGGGGGCAEPNVATNTGGGNGAAGLIIVREYA